MLLVNQSHGFANRVGFEKAVQMNKAAGFDAMDLSMDVKYAIDRIMQEDWRDFAAELKAISEKYDMPFVQAHAPFGFYDAFKTGKPYGEIYREVILPQTLRAMEVAAAVGVEIIVVHPMHNGDYHVCKDLFHEQSMVFYRELIPHCERLGIKIALENMFQSRPQTRIIEADTCSSPYEFAAWLDELSSVWVTGCLDIGHCGLVGEDVANAIKVIGADRLGCLHIHDNDFKSDFHTLPGTGSIDYDAVTAALGEVGYKGNFTYESSSFPAKFPTELLPSVAQFMQDVGRYWMSKIN